MNKRKITAVTASLLIMCGAASAATAFAATGDTHTVTVVDFDGNVLDTISVKDGEALDLSKIDVESLERYEGIYTQIRFDSWSTYPDKITEDITVYALYKKMTLSLDGLPEKTEYYSNTGSIDLNGLKVTISVYTQLPEKDKDGNFILSEEILPIESKCTTSPASLDEAFKDGNTAAVNVYPIVGEKAIATYDITYYPHLGDADMDNAVNASDASLILGFYAQASTGTTPEYADGQFKRCDVDGNTKVDSNDASLVLIYYAKASTSHDADWEQILNGE